MVSPGRIRVRAPDFSPALLFSLSAPVAERSRLLALPFLLLVGLFSPFLLVPGGKPRHLPGSPGSHTPSQAEATRAQPPSALRLSSLAQEFWPFGSARAA